MGFLQKTYQKIASQSAKYQATLIAVTKRSNVTDMQAAIDTGISNIAENKIQVAKPKFAKLDRECTKHFIGPIQTNKIKDIVRLFDVIHSVDRPKVYRKICAQAELQQKSIKVLFQVNLTGEEQKHGFDENSLDLFLSATDLKRSFVEPIGLMAMGPMTEDTDHIRSVFRSVKVLSDKYASIIGSEISMGMSGDYEIALEEGSTMLRIGSVLFG